MRSTNIGSVSTTAAQSLQTSETPLACVAQIVARRREEIRFGEVRALGDLLLPLQVRSHFLGSDPQAHQLLEQSVGPYPQTAHSGDEKHHQRGAQAVQNRIGGEEARRHEGKRRRKKKEQERGKIGAEDGDRARRDAEGGQKHHELGVDAAADRQPERRPAKTDPDAKIDRAEPERPGAPSIACRSRPPVEAPEDEVEHAEDV